MFYIFQLYKEFDKPIQCSIYTFQVFGVPISELPTGEGNIPFVVDRLITTIEMTGLYVEGLYRKSGLSSKVC